MQFIKDLSFRQVASELKIHRNTVTKYVNYIEKNIRTLKSALIQEGKCEEDFADEFIKGSWREYIDEIINYKHERQKRKTTIEFAKEVLSLKKILNTTSPTVIYKHIQKGPKSSLTDISYSSIRRILKSN